MKRIVAVVMPLLVAAWLVFAGGNAQAEQLISINADYLDSEFSYVDGTWGIGELTVSDGADIVVEYGGSQVTFDNGTFRMLTSLFSDDSSGNLASGLFVGGSITIRDADENPLLTATVTELSLYEVFDGIGVLSGVGSFAVTGGSLEEDFGFPTGELVQITFNLSDSGIDDFASDFTGTSNITLVPIPEPATMLLLGTGMIGVAGIIRRRRMK